MTPDVNVVVAASRVDHPLVNPTPMTAALEFVDALFGMPGVHQPELGAEWPHLRTLCAKHTLSANDVPDAWLAAAVISQGEHPVTFDRDFRRLLGRNQFTRLR